MDETVRQHKFVLDESEMPTAWYNLVPDLPSPPPPALHPGTLQPAGPDDFAPLFPMDLILQEVSMDRYIEIPGAVLDVYRQWRPSPLFRAHRLEQALGTPARIYYKYEGVSPAGSHKPNTAVPQAYYNAKAGVKKLTTETGAGQWGTALAFACALFDLECEIWQVGASYDQKPYRRMMMETFGGVVHRSPSPLTESGRRYLAEDPDHPGSLGIAISEAVEVAAQDPEIRYSLGSVLNHVLMHQTIIGEEALLQLRKAGETAPDLIVGCTGGGSNFGGLSFPFLREKLAGNMSPTIRAVEPASCPSLTHGVYAYDFGDAAGLTPLMKMHTLGHDFVPDPIHAGGLRYHGMSPLLSPRVRTGSAGGRGHPADGVLRGRHPLRPHRGHRARPRAHPRAGRGHPRGAGGQGDRRGDGHPHRPVRARPLRPGRLRRLPVGGHERRSRSPTSASPPPWPRSPMSAAASGSGDERRPATV